MNITLANADSNSPLLLVVKLCGILVPCRRRGVVVLLQRRLDGVDAGDGSGYWLVCYRPLANVDGRRKFIAKRDILLVQIYLRGLSDVGHSAPATYYAALAPLLHG